MYAINEISLDVLERKKLYYQITTCQKPNRGGDLA